MEKAKKSNFKYKELQLLLKAVSTCRGYPQPVRDFNIMTKWKKHIEEVISVSYPHRIQKKK